MHNKTHTTSQDGYAILFAVLLVSIILAITLGVLNIALKEFKFTSTARNSHISFFAADTGGECALFNKKIGRFNGISLSQPPTMDCDTQTGITSTATDLTNGIARFDFQPIDVQGGCALVSLTIDNSSTQVSKTIIDAHGYNYTCANLSANSETKVERLLSYEFTEIAGGTAGTGGSGGTGTGGTGNGSGTAGTPIGPPNNGNSGN